VYKLVYYYYYYVESPELYTDWIHPRIVLDWVTLGQDFQGTLWIGLDGIGAMTVVPIFN